MRMELINESRQQNCERCVPTCKSRLTFIRINGANLFGCFDRALRYCKMESTEDHMYNKYYSTW